LINAHSRSLKNCGFQSPVVAEADPPAVARSAACAVLAAATAPTLPLPITTVGIKAIDFTKKSRLELLVFSLDILTFLSIKLLILLLQAQQTLLWNRFQKGTALADLLARRH
jgi:hypothetical protein